MAPIEEHPLNPTVSRRAVLGAGAITLAGLGLDGALEQEASAATLQGRLPHRVDAVVVGAGISGLVAARRLARHGRSVLVVEARRRVGGRVLNHRLHSGGTIEAGGAFIGPTQDHIRALADELGVRSFPEYTTGLSLYKPLASPSPLPYAGTIPPDPEAADALALVARIDTMASEIDVRAPWRHPRARYWDSITLAEWIERNSSNPPAVRRLLSSWTQPGFGANPRQLSFLYTLWYVACSGNEDNKGTFERNADSSDGAQQRRFVGGAGLIPQRLARQLGHHVALGAPVHRIVQRDGHVVVHTGRGRVRARQVVVAATPEKVLGIDWHPHLPARRAALLRHMHMGRLMKCDAVYPTPFWRAKGLNGFGINESGAVRVAFDNCPGDGDEGVLLAFVGGDTWRRYDRLGQAERREAVLRGFAELFGEQALHPTEYTEHDWAEERWTRGGPVAIMGPRTLTRFGPAIRRPFGRVHWAGTETSTYWTGYMDGAVRAGKRAANEVLASRRAGAR